MKFPYGIADFEKIRLNGYFYQDRTDKIPLLEEAGEQLLFIRPRRFGKSLLLSMLENYYDLNKADKFDSLFLELAIAQEPTARHNQYLVMKWDFSSIKASGRLEEIEKAIHRHINSAIDKFSLAYQQILTPAIKIYEDDAISSFQSLLNSLQASGRKIYLLIDEYDNFANEIMMARKVDYEALLYGEGLLKAVFKAVKSAAGGQGLDKVFITGVSPVVMSDMTSGYNVATNIYLDEEFDDLCGFSEMEIQQILQAITEDKSKADKALKQMKTFYNGYCFNENQTKSVYNPTLSLHFFRYFQKHQTYPRNMLDENLAMDRNKLNYIASLQHGESILLAALNDEQGITIEQLSQRFGVEDVLNEPKDHAFMASLLYYFGVLTLAGHSDFGELVLKIPNLVVRALYAERLQNTLLPEYEDKKTIENLGKRFYQHAEIQPLCDFIENRYFKILANRDYRWSNELMVKFAFMSLLFNDTYYIMESEAETGRKYPDLSMILRPQMRQYKLLDLLIEFKFLPLNELGLSADDIKQKPLDELSELPAVKKQLEQAERQAVTYAGELEEKYGELRLHSFAVVALGFDRLVWKTVQTET